MYKTDPQNTWQILNFHKKISIPDGFILYVCIKLENFSSKH